MKNCIILFSFQLFEWRGLGGAKRCLNEGVGGIFCNIKKTRKWLKKQQQQYSNCCHKNKTWHWKMQKKNKKRKSSVPMSYKNRQRQYKKNHPNYSFQRIRSRRRKQISTNKVWPFIICFFFRHFDKSYQTKHEVNWNVLRKQTATNVPLYLAAILVLIKGVSTNTHQCISYKSPTYVWNSISSSNWICTL